MKPWLTRESRPPAKPPDQPLDLMADERGVCLACDSCCATRPIHHRLADRADGGVGNIGTGVVQAEVESLLDGVWLAGEPTG
jgi:hypothetical protein